MPAVFDRSQVYDSIIDVIGGTPLVRLKRLMELEGIKCDILAKCEFLNPGGSVKDRIARRMLSKGEEKGKIRKGATIIEPTSGNTGIGLAMFAAVMGYKSITVIPEKMSNEKVELLKALGSKIYRTPTQAPSSSPESHIGVARRLNEEIKNSWIPDQYTNEDNWKAHYLETAEEILVQCDYKLDTLISAAGTGGTVTGIGKRLKEELPNVRIIGVDPYGSVLADPDRPVPPEHDKPYLVEGIGYDFVPDVLDRSVVDEWIKVGDEEAFTAARKVLEVEGILCGGSSGSALSAALKVARGMKKGQRLVVILPDGIRNYMSRHLMDDWMVYNKVKNPNTSVLKDTKDGKLDPNLTLSVLDSSVINTIDINSQISDALNPLAARGLTHIVVIPDESHPNTPLAVLSRATLVSLLMTGHTLDTKLREVVKEGEVLGILCHDSRLMQAIEEISSKSYVLVKPRDEEASDLYPSLRIITDVDLFAFVAKYGVDISLRKNGKHAYERNPCCTSSG